MYFVFCGGAVLWKTPNLLQHVWAIRLFCLCLGHYLGTATVRGSHSICVSCSLHSCVCVCVCVFDGDSLKEKGLHDFVRVRAYMKLQWPLSVICSRT